MLTSPLRAYPVVGRKSTRTAPLRLVGGNPLGDRAEHHGLDRGRALEERAEGAVDDDERPERRRRDDRCVARAARHEGHLTEEVTLPESRDRTALPANDRLAGDDRNELPAGFALAGQLAPLRQRQLVGD